MNQERLYLLICVSMNKDIDDIRNVEWLIEQDYLTEEGELTVRGEQAICYAVKKAGEI